MLIKALGEAREIGVSFWQQGHGQAIGAAVLPLSPRHLKKYSTKGEFRSGRMRAFNSIGGQVLHPRPMAEMRKRTDWMIAAGLAVVTAVLYLPTAGHQFLSYDDQEYITENNQVSAGLTIAGLRWAFGFHASNWHPLTWLSHMMDCELFGLHPAGHHLTSVLLHVTNTVLLFFLLKRMTRLLWASAVVAGLFAWHPLHVESVAWVAERKDVLSALFWLLSLGAMFGMSNCMRATGEAA